MTGAASKAALALDGHQYTAQLAKSSLLTAYSMTSSARPRRVRRDGEPERPGGFEIDHQLELGRLFDGKIGRLGPLQDPIHVPGGTPLDIITGYAIRHQAAAIADEYRSSVHRRQLVPSREFTHSGAVNSENGLGFQSPVKS
jgi:hypothetical protein